MTLAGQALVAGSLIIIGVNLIWLWVVGELPPLRGLIEPPHPVLTAALFIIAFGFWVIYKNLRGLRKKR